MQSIPRSLFCLFAAAGLTLGAFAATPTHTLKNLDTAFRGEANAANRYQQFALQAEKDGHAQVAKLFRAASKSETIHRDRHAAVIKKLGGQVPALDLDPVKVGTTAENLTAAISGETYERNEMYPGFIATARSENARAAIATLQGALEAEKEHAALFTQALAQLGNNPVADYYVCPTCGNTVTERPTKSCPVCREKPGKFMMIT